MLCIVQVLVLNHIHLFNYATPLLYVYFALVFPLNYPKWATLLWCFALGLVIDIFTNTPGLAATSLTFIGAVQPYYARLFAPQDSADDLRLSFATIGVPKFTFYIVTLVIVYCLLFFSLEAFSFFNWVQWTWNVLGSAVVTSVLIITIESVRKK